MRTLLATCILISFSYNSLGQNLISNSSFENGMMNLECNDWYSSCGYELTYNCDTSLFCNIKFVPESPSDAPEEIWCISIKANFPNEGFAETYVTGHSGTNIYKLEYFMKSPNWDGHVSIGTKTQNQFIESKKLIDSTSIWKDYVLYDTLTTIVTDTITVRLSAGIGDFCSPCTSLFDFIKLSILNPSSSLNNHSQFENDEMIAYPNPSGENIIIEFKGSKNENHRLTVYSMTGIPIKSIENRSNVFTIDINDLSSGSYYYIVQSKMDKKVVGKGRFIKN